MCTGSKQKASAQNLRNFSTMVGFAKCGNQNINGISTISNVVKRVAQNKKLHTQFKSKQKPNTHRA